MDGSFTTERRRACAKADRIKAARPDADWDAEFNKELERLVAVAKKHKESMKSGAPVKKRAKLWNGTGPDYRKSKPDFLHRDFHP